MESIPDDVLAHALSFLNARDACRASAVSRAWRRAALSPAAWSHIALCVYDDGSGEEGDDLPSEATSGASELDGDELDDEGEWVEVEGDEESVGEHEELEGSARSSGGGDRAAGGGDDEEEEEPSEAAGDDGGGSEQALDSEGADGFEEEDGSSDGVGSSGASGSYEEAPSARPVRPDFRADAAARARALGCPALLSAAAAELLRLPRFSGVSSLQLIQFGAAPLAPVLAAAPRGVRRLSLLCREKRDEEREDDPEPQDVILGAGVAEALAGLRIEELELGRASGKAAVSLGPAVASVRTLRGWINCRKGVEDLRALRAAYPLVKHIHGTLQGRHYDFPKEVAGPGPTADRLSLVLVDDREEADCDIVPAALRACVAAGMSDFEILMDFWLSSLGDSLAGIKALTILFAESEPENFIEWLSEGSKLAGTLEYFSFDMDAFLDDLPPGELLKALARFPRLATLEVCRPPVCFNRSAARHWSRFFSSLPGACPGLLHLEPEDGADWDRTEPWRRRARPHWQRECAAAFAAAQGALARRRAPAAPAAAAAAAPSTSPPLEEALGTLSLS
eukprot:tig00021133_g18914.t1